MQSPRWCPYCMASLPFRPRELPPRTFPTPPFVVLHWLLRWPFGPAVFVTALSLDRLLGFVPWRWTFLEWSVSPPRHDIVVRDPSSTSWVPLLVIVVPEDRGTAGPSRSALAGRPLPMRHMPAWPRRVFQLWYLGFPLSTVSRS